VVVVEIDQNINCEMQETVWRPGHGRNNSERLEKKGNSCDFVLALAWIPFYF